MNDKVRWVKSDNPDASDAAPTLARSPMTWERAAKVLTDDRLDADDTNPVPAVGRARARADATEEVALDDVLEVAEVSAPPSERDRKTEPPSSRSRKTDPPSSRNRKTDPPSSARLIPKGAPVPHWTDPSLRLPLPAPLPSAPGWVADAHGRDARREATMLHTRPRQPKSRLPFVLLGALAGAVVAALIVLVVLPPSTDTAAATAAHVPTFRGSQAKHRVERSIGRGPVVPVYAVSALPR